SMLNVGRSTPTASTIPPHAYASAPAFRLLLFQRSPALVSHNFLVHDHLAHRHQHPHLHPRPPHLRPTHPLRRPLRPRHRPPAIFGVLAPAANLAPGVQLRMWFPPIAITLRTMFWIMVGIAALTIYTGGFNNGGEAAHLGGAAMGALLIRKVNWLNFSPGPRR